MKHNTTFNGKNYFLAEISDILTPKKCFHKTQTIPNCQFDDKPLKKNLILDHTQSPLLIRYKFNKINMYPVITVKAKSRRNSIYGFKSVTIT